MADTHDIILLHSISTSFTNELDNHLSTMKRNFIIFIIHNIINKLNNLQLPTMLFIICELDDTVSVHSNWLTLLWSSLPMFLPPISVCYVISDYFDEA